MNNEFDNMYNIKKHKVFDVHHVYYIDSFHTSFNNTNITTLYIADKTIKLDQYTKIRFVTDHYLVIECDFGDGVPRSFKAFPSKEMAQIELEKLKGK